jgi:hypothetical protein
VQERTVKISAGEDRTGQDRRGEDMEVQERTVKIANLPKHDLVAPCSRGSR